MTAAPLRTVLYVDDEPDIREIVQIALGLTKSLTVHTAHSGEQALTQVRTLRPDLVLLDVMMPGLDGPATFNRMRTDTFTAAIPVIFMTARAMPREVALLLAIGALGVIAKPFDPMRLGAQVISLWHGRLAEPPNRTQVVDNSGLHRQVTNFGERFLRRTREETVLLLDLIRIIQPGDVAEIEELKNLAHRIRGSGSTFGFAAVSRCAAEIELLVESLRQHDAGSAPTMESKLRHRLTECTQRLSREIEVAAAGRSIDAPSRSRAARRESS